MKPFRKTLGTVLCAALIAAAVISPISAESLGFDELYQGWSASGLALSEKTARLEGRTVTMTGYMAPPLTPTIRFFVLTGVPMSICPFCNSDADWPEDIIVVKTDGSVTALPYDSPISVTGTLEVGSEMDEETGFVSQLRIVATAIETL